MKNKYPPHIYRKLGVYYFTRRVPKSLSGYYAVDKIAISLRTKSITVAQARAAKLSQQLEDEWSNLIWNICESPLSRYRYETNIAHNSPQGPKIDEAKAIYIEQTGMGRPKAFFSAVDRAVSYLIDCCGNKPIDRITRTDVNKVRDKLISKGLTTASVKRNLNTLRALVE